VTNALETRNLGRRYGSTWALRDCTLQLPRGAVAALVGPNGAGKSTLLHLAVGILQATEGSVSILGEAMRGQHPEMLARIGFVAQDAEFQYIEAGIFGGLSLLCLGWTFWWVRSRLR
jgi:ABC-2 type transport system ATP-binding protein